MRRRRSRNRDEPSPVGQIFTKVAKLALGCVIVVGLAEWGAGFAVGKIRHNRVDATPALSDQDISRLYDTDKPQLYRDVLTEESRLGEAQYSPLVEYRPAAHVGRYFTVSGDGYRGNGAPQDLSAQGSTVFVFGGSTTFGSGVPDAETLPAFLEQSLRNAGKTVQVFNFGAPSYYSTQERVALERLLTAGVKPDVAVFVDGLGDFQSCQLPDRTAWSDRLGSAMKVAAQLPLTVELANRSNLVALGRWLVGEPPAEDPGRAGAQCNTTADVERVIRRLDTNHRIIAAMADRLGFKAVFVQQPVPTFHYDNAKRAVPVKTELLAQYMNSAKAYPRMVEMRAAGQLLSDNTLWLAEMEPSDGNAYIDTVHYSPRFNRLIADSIARHILDTALLP